MHDSNNHCRLCASDTLRTFLTMRNVPVHSCVLWPSREAAAGAPRGDITLAFCEQCGFISNLAFDPAALAYGEDYDNALHHSPLFDAYAQSLAEDLVGRYNVRDKTVLEIGCGNGDFLKRVCRLGNNRGIGFDPSCHPPAETAPDEPADVTFVRELYSPEHAQCDADLVCCRQVFEHIPNPKAFLTEIRRTLGRRHDAVVFFEVPDTRFPLADLSVWDVIYEHCSYFTRESLAFAFASTGFDILRLYGTFENQYLCVEARPAAADSSTPPQTSGDDLAELTTLVDGFAAHVQQRTAYWQQKLTKLAAENRTVVAWGAGARGVSFLNAVGDAQAIECVVDMNPAKHGRFIPGSGQRVIAPDALADDPPDDIILMNRNYEQEIRDLTTRMGLTPTFHLA